MPHVDETETDEEKAANERDVAKVKAAKEKPEPDDDDEELQADGPAAKEEEEIRPSRADKKRERGRSLVQQAEERARNAELERDRARQDALEARQVALEARTRPAPGTEAKDPLIEERDQLRREHTAFMARYRELSGKEGVSQAEIDKLENEAWDIKERMDSNVVKRQLAANKPKEHEERQKAAQTDAMTQLHARHGDVTRDQRATKYFQANYAKLLANNEPDNWDTLDKAMDQTRAELRMTPRGGPPAPSAATRARLSGMARGGGGGAEEPKEKGIKVTPEIKRMANLAYPHLPKEKRLQAWANASGKHLEDA